MTATRHNMRTLDTKRRFVRFRGERANGFVEFDFAIGEPEVFVELILDKKSFKEFCIENEVEMLRPDKSKVSESDDLSSWDWRLADATSTRCK